MGGSSGEAESVFEGPLGDAYGTAGRNLAQNANDIYTGQRVAGIDDMSRQAMGGVQGMVNAGDPTRNLATGMAQGAIRGGQQGQSMLSGFGQAGQAGTSMLQQAGGAAGQGLTRLGQMTTGDPMMQGTAGQVMDYAAKQQGTGLTGLNALEQTAAGSGMPSEEAIRQAGAPLIQDFQRITAPGLNASAVAAGRTGSGAAASQMSTAQQDLSYGLGRATTDLISQERDRQMQAAGQLSQLGAQNQGLLGSLYQGDQAQQMAASQGLMGAGLQAGGQLQQAGLSAAGQLQQGGFQGAALGEQQRAAEFGELGMLNSMGQQRQANQQALLDSSQQKSSELWNRQLDLMGALSGGTALGERSNAASPGQAALGGAAMGAGMGATVGGPWGAALGGVAGAGMGYLGYA